MEAHKLKARGISDHLKAARDDFKHVASILPSSSRSVRSILKFLPKPTRDIVEFGTGNGVVTKEILKRLPPNGKLIGIEINARFVSTLKTINDPRFSLLEGDVIQLAPHLSSYFPQGVDAIVSGIPFSLLDQSHRDAIVKHSRLLLRPQGRMIVYQSSPLMVRTLSRYFRKVTWHFEPRNFLPYFIMVARV